MRYRLDVAYHGGGFHGWQLQPNARTVQGELELWLGRLIGSGTRVPVTGAGRTDAGVHAARMTAHFDSPVPLDCSSLLERLRTALPRDLAALALTLAPPEFHARFSARSRRYSYQIRLSHSPFERDRQWRVYEPLDFELLVGCGHAVLGRHDFSGFCRAASLRENNHCHVMQSEWTSGEDTLVYTIQADRFLHQMVRLLVGTFVDIARGRWEIARLTDILSTGDLRLAGETAPPHGLTLEEVGYPSQISGAPDFG